MFFLWLYSTYFDLVVVVVVAVVVVVVVVAVVAAAAAAAAAAAVVVVVCWLLNVPATCLDGPVQTILSAATLRQKLQIQLSTPPTHSIRTPGQPVAALTAVRETASLTLNHSRDHP